MIFHHLFMRVVLPGFFVVLLLDVRRQARKAKTGTRHAARSPQMVLRHGTLGCAALGGLAGVLFILAGLITRLP
ncbi:hypothetical protein BIV57_03915 [Mangrovactinospora gilvigrisea]|uniref:Uncharacterized protein n=1 Tax=Mangrovactinospora gilvigrisea TaxID=1428644 RepID=A0A1J7CB64_9ACTN|nr:hypothetical protein [Mangrovactinospora gilvigrisea]OIV38764.1 hypothetical protein BIV57_03915 [Mangrovactinospora gilvigrisea]